MSIRLSRKRKLFFLVIVFTCGILSAGLLLLWRGKGNTAAPPLPNQPLEVQLESLDSDNIPSVGEWQRKGEAVIAISPDENWIAVTGSDEFVRLFDTGGREQWHYRIPEGYGRALTFSTDSKMLFVGECSMDGMVYAIDVRQGEKRWHAAISPDVGRPASNRPMTYKTLDKCCVYALQASESALFMVGTHRDRCLTEGEGGAMVVNDTLDTVMYACDPATGKPLWRYPAKGTMDTHMPYPLYSKSLEHLVGANTSYWREGMPVETYPNGSVRLIDAQTGLQSCAYRIMPTFASFTSIWYSLSVSPNGHFISAGTTDGRLILFEVKEGPSLVAVWEKEVSSLLEISGIPIYACSSNNAVFDNGDVFMTSSSTHSKQTSAGIVRQPPTQHPDSNSAFLFDRQGRIVWKWKAPGDITDMRIDMETGLIAIIVEHNYVEQSLDAAGFYFMRYSGTEQDPVKRLGAFQLSGISTSGAISASGSFFAGVEMPVRLTDDTLVGEHKLHIIPIQFLLGPSDDE